MILFHIEIPLDFVVLPFFTRLVCATVFRFKIIYALSATFELFTSNNMHIIHMLTLTYSDTHTHTYICTDQENVNQNKNNFFFTLKKNLKKTSSKNKNEKTVITHIQLEKEIDTQKRRDIIFVNSLTSE